MSTAAWSGTALITHPQIVTEVHAAFLRAGADVIITNTFGSARFMLAAAGTAAEFERVNQLAVDCARRARLDGGADDVAIAGSMSNLPPHFDVSEYPAAAQEQRDYEELATLLAAAGVDLLALEMLQDTEHAPRAMRAAKATGLPVWLGISIDRTVDGRLVGFDRRQVSLHSILTALLRLEPDVVNIMHTPIAVIDEAIEVVRRYWSGPLGVYPEIGYFTAPDWQFDPDATPARLAQHARRWIEAGVALIGGCCGTGPEHIEALRAVAAAR
jgi:methionine synthase I (cobalamin-dependent)